MTADNFKNEKQEEKPPFFKTWKRLYAFVLINLAATILIFYMITIFLR